MSSISGPAGPVPQEVQSSPPAPPAPPAGQPRPASSAPPARPVHRGLWAGVLLIVLGLYLLLVNLGLTWWWDWTFGGPALLIAAGILLLMRRLR